MELFALDDEVARLQLLVDSDNCSLEQVVSLAWHMRQRNSNCALSLAHRVSAQVQQQGAQGLKLRLELVYGEIHWLSAKLDQAQRCADQVIQQATSLAEENISEQQRNLLLADAHWLLGWLYFEKGLETARDQAWASMQSISEQADETSRVEFARAALATMQSFRNPMQMQGLADAYIAQDVQKIAPAARAAVFDFLAFQVRLGSHAAQASSFWIEAFELAQKSGQIRRAIFAACNVGECFSNFNDHDINLQWLECALALARRNNWPGAMGHCLSRTAACMRKLGRTQAASELIDEALQVMQPVAGSRNHSNALLWKADMLLEQHEYQAALDMFDHLLQLAIKQNHSDLAIYARQGQVRALSRLQRGDEALQVAETTFSVGQRNDNFLAQVITLQLLAKLYDDHALPPPSGISASTPQLHYLQQAYQMAEAIGGMAISGDLLNEIALAHAKAGNFAIAYEFSQKAISAYQHIHHDAISNRASAIELQHKAERNRIESEHLRQLAQEQARRAQILQDANATLANLGAIGQEITAQLDLEAVFFALKRHVINMLPTSYMALMLTDQEGTSLYSIFRQQGEHSLPALHIHLDDLHSFAAQCVRERREIEVAKARGEYNPALTPDAHPTLSALFGPLIIGQRILGVMTIQSEEEYVYGERERLIFRSLCAYGAIALANAHAYTQLQQAQQKLVAQEKLAALGTLVAGVAHELNTPLGNSLVALSGLQDQINTIANQLALQNLRASDLHRFITDSQELSNLCMRSLHNAADLVSHFKQIATTRKQQEYLHFNLRQLTNDIIESLQAQIRVEGHQVSVDIAADLQLHSYPEAYTQVITNLIHNALTHAFSGIRQGHIRIEAQLFKNQRVHVCVSDNGLGIEQQHVKFIFDPFFTTRLGQGGNGLGLAICYNIVTSILEGQITVSSIIGKGTTFTLDLPLRVGE